MFILTYTRGFLEFGGSISGQGQKGFDMSFYPASTSYWLGFPYQVGANPVSGDHFSVWMNCWLVWRHSWVSVSPRTKANTEPNLPSWINAWPSWLKPARVRSVPLFALADGLLRFFLDAVLMAYAWVRKTGIYSKTAQWSHQKFSLSHWSFAKNPSSDGKCDALWP